jgi:uncharacterized protein YecA (UPF0149 family)
MNERFVGMPYLAVRVLAQCLAERDTSPRGHAEPVISRQGPRTSRNDPCPCGSGKKFKSCCRNKTTSTHC